MKKTIEFNGCSVAIWQSTCGYQYELTISGGPGGYLARHNIRPGPSRAGEEGFRHILSNDVSFAAAEDAYDYALSLLPRRERKAFFEGWNITRA